MKDSVSVKEFARMVGKSHVWILRLLNQGKLPRNEDGTIPLREAMEAYKIRLENPSKGGAPTHKKNLAKAEQNPQEPKDEKKVSESLGKLDESININAAMTKAKLAEKTFQARLRELEYKLKSGELVERVAVANEAAWVAEQVKAKLNAIPPRISGMCEGRIAREIEEIITDAINGALKELQKCKYTEDEAVK